MPEDLYHSAGPIVAVVGVHCLAGEALAGAGSRGCTVPISSPKTRTSLHQDGYPYE